MRKNDNLILASSQWLDGKLQGKSVKYSQILNSSSVTSQTINGVTFTNNNNGSITISGTATADTTKNFSQSFENIQNHKLFLYGCVGGSNSTYYFGSPNVGSVKEIGNGFIYTYPYSWSDVITFKILSGTTINKTLYPQLIDLTELGLDNITTLDQFYQTDLGKIIKSGKYLNYGSGILNATAPLRFNGGKSVDLGTLDWTYNSSSQRFRTILSPSIDAKRVGYSQLPNIYCSKYETGTNAQLDNVSYDKRISFTDNSSVFYILIRDTNYTDANALKNSLSGTILYYEGNDGTPLINTEYSRTSKVDLGSLNGWYVSNGRMFLPISQLGFSQASSNDKGYDGVINCYKRAKGNETATKAVDKSFCLSSPYLGAYAIIYDSSFTGTTTQDIKNYLSGIYLEYEPATQLELRGVGEISSLLGKQDVALNDTRASANNYVMCLANNNFSLGYTLLSNCKSVTLNNTHKYFICVKATYQTLNTDWKGFYNSSYGHLATTTKELYVNGNFKCLKIQPTNSETAYPCLAFKNGASNETIYFALVIDLTTCGLDTLTAQQFYDQYNKHFEYLASGGTIAKLCDTLSNCDGKTVRKIGSVDLGTLNWVYDSGFSVFHVDNFSEMKERGKLSCSKYIIDLEKYASTLPNNTLTNRPFYTRNNICIKDTAYTDATAFKNSLNGVILNYELATYTTETKGTLAIPKLATKCTDANGMEIDIERNN